MTEGILAAVYATPDRTENVVKGVPNSKDIYEYIYIYVYIYVYMYITSTEDLHVAD